MTSVLLPMSLQEKKREGALDLSQVITADESFHSVAAAGWDPVGSLPPAGTSVTSASAVQSLGLSWDLGLLCASIWALKMSSASTGTLRTLLSLQLLQRSR